MDLRSAALQFFNWRRPGGMLSASGHIALFVVGVVGLSTTKPFTPAQETMAVDMISEQQFNEMMKGEQKAKPAPEPQRRVDRVAELKQDRDPGEAKKDVAAEPPKVQPKPEPAVEPPKVAAVTPPAPPVPAPPLRTQPPKPVEPEEEEEEVEVPLKKAAPKKPEPPKPDPLQKLIEEQKRSEEKARQEAAAKAAEEKRKADEKRLADEKKRLDAEKKAREAKEKAAKEAADAKKLEDSIRQRLLTSREAPASSGATGAAPSRQASLGNPNASGRKLSPSERGQLIGLLTDQMNRCLSIPPGAIPKGKPIVALSLGRDGSITGGPTLTNPSGEAGYMPYAEANMRALRSCAPYRIPPKFLDTYDDWKQLRIGFDPSEMG